MQHPGCLSRVAACLSFDRQELCLWLADSNTGLVIRCMHVSPLVAHLVSMMAIQPLMLCLELHLA